MGEETGQGGPGPLEYRSGRDEPNPFVERALCVIKVVVGFFLGVIGIVVVGAFSTVLAESRPEFEFRSVPLAVAYFALAIGGGGGVRLGVVAGAAAVVFGWVAVGGSAGEFDGGGVLFVGVRGRFTKIHMSFTKPFIPGAVFRG